MDAETLQLMGKLNLTINRIRGIYALWVRENQMKYHEMLILYSLQECSYCTQGYLLLTPDPADRRVKYIHLTASGKRYAENALASLRAVEQETVAQAGAEQLKQMTDTDCLKGFVNHEPLTR